jgi:hypothetical protein
VLVQVGQDFIDSFAQGEGEVGWQIRDEGRACVQGWIVCCGERVGAHFEMSGEVEVIGDGKL